ncbi:response regulator [Roseixanthobacter glucoisosaccharinicivorans]|uniref:response regulator n=1 Tax=Roseixanthobacter glucoisosaccharinicivorans TaxID=3119923 RepID=UPI0037264949
MRLHILYVDDEPDIREIVTLALSLDPQIGVDTAPSGAAALALAGEKSFDLILLDVMMPSMDGPTTLMQLQQRRLAPPAAVAFVTARTQAHEITHFMTLGAIGVIAKPFDAIHLARDVRALMEQPRR